jgi:GTP pyrophosphokinase
VTRAFERAGKAFSEDKLKGALARLARPSVEDVLAAVGRGELVSGDVVRAVHRDFKEERKAPASRAQKYEGGWFGLRKAASLLFRVPGAEGESPSASIPIRGQGRDLPVKFASNGAVPGDRIIGILTPGEGITIYPIQSPALSAFDDQPERWLDVRWDLDEGRQDAFPVQIVVNCLNEPGALGVVTTVIGEHGANIDHVEFVQRTPDVRDIFLNIGVFDLKHLNTILAQIKAKTVVTRAERVNG